MTYLKRGLTSAPTCAFPDTQGVTKTLFVSVIINTLTANSLFSNPEYNNDGVFGRNDIFG